MGGKLPPQTPVDYEGEAGIKASRSIQAGVWGAACPQPFLAVPKPAMGGGGGMERGGKMGCGLEGMRGLTRERPGHDADPMGAGQIGEVAESAAVG